MGKVTAAAPSREGAFGLVLKGVVRGVADGPIANGWKSVMFE